MAQDNQIETKNKVWKPPIFNSPEELEQKIDKYFEDWFRKKKVFTTAWIEIIIPKITMTDLAIYLWFDSRQSLYDYEEKKDYSYTIKRARLFIEREYEERLDWQYSTWAIFALKNLWWKDKSEVDNTIKWELNINNYKNLSTEQLLALKQKWNDWQE